MNQPTERPRHRGRRLGRILLGILLGLIALWSIGAIGLSIWKSVWVPEEAPVIGLSLDPAWYQRLGLSQAAYEIAMIRVRARSLPFRPGAQSVDSILSKIDGLLLCGGGDVDPKLYGGDEANTYGIFRRHDTYEIDLIEGALTRGIPILGICRGIQILNVGRGGTLRNLHAEPSLASRHGITLHSLNAHDVEIREGTLLSQIDRSGSKRVNSFHGHAVDRLGAGLSAVAVAEDGVVEAIEDYDRPFVVGIQWHPEILSLRDARELEVFRRFVYEARRARAR